MPHKDPAARSAYNKAYRERRIEKYMAYDRERNKTPERKLARRLNEVKVRHRIEPQRYHELLSAGCWLCREAFAAEEETHVDHDHACCETTPTCGDCVRGLTHAGCNKSIGYLKESPVRLETIARSLRDRAWNVMCT